MDKLIAPVAKISLDEKGEILLTGMEISPYKHSQLASPVAGMKVQRYHHKLFLTITVTTISKQQNCLASGIKFSHINKRNSSCLPGCLIKRASPASI
jgi:hypothetical protein